MDISATKLSVVQKILSVSESALLDKINALLDKEMVVGYTASGEPLTKQAYNQRLLQAEAQLKAGQCTSQQDLEKEVENW